MMEKEKEVKLILDVTEAFELCTALSVVKNMDDCTDSFRKFCVELRLKVATQMSEQITNDDVWMTKILLDAKDHLNDN